MYWYCLLLGDPPDIDEGPFIPRPPTVKDGKKKVKIGSPVYIREGANILIDCDIANGTPPITIQWFRNGSPDPTRGNVSTITITDARNGDVFKCRADNNIGFDSESTIINIIYGKWIDHAYMYVCILILAWGWLSSNEGSHEYLRTKGEGGDAVL